MEIKKGDTFKCIKDVVMSDGSIVYKKDHIYKSEQDECITDGKNNKVHYWFNDMCDGYFILIKAGMKEYDTIAEVYKKASDEVKKQLKEKFSDEELGLNFVPKNGDIVSFCWDGDRAFNALAIIKGKTYLDPSAYYVYICLDKYKKLRTDWFNLFNARPASQQEKQKLFDRMKEDGLQWNEKEKKVENIRWRAKFLEEYFFIDDFLEINSNEEDNTLVDKKMYNNGNYFQTKEKAKIKRDKIRKILMEDE